MRPQLLNIEAAGQTPMGLKSNNPTQMRGVVMGARGFEPL